jgi:lipopolysaccharide/colanic/teichoic acid biosynthesis glycosyltransferase
MEGRGCYEVAYVAGRPIESLIDIIARVNATTVVAARHRIGNALDIAACVERGVVFRSAASVFEELTGRVPVTYLGSHEDTACALPDRSSRCDLAYRTAKRAADIVLASAGMVVLVIMLPIVALAISIDSPGPIFYSQERLGRGGRPFRAWKFRSMIADAEQGRPQWAAANDVRVTRVGRLLRAAHLDEFPQFLNILKGEMSAVGPRPERPEFAEVLSRELPFYNMRHGTKPGMAGWGLVNQGYSSSSEDAALKLEYDLYYLKYQSCWLDLVILMKTAIDTLMLRGR